MINSNTRKLTLSGWLKNNSHDCFNTSLKLQKFLFFYESFSKVKINGDADFTNLMGFKNGPVFSKVYGDYTYERLAFNDAIEDAYKTNKNIINDSIAKKVNFIVNILTTNELSELTHKMNIWKSKEDRILSGEKYVELSENDFNANDVEIINTLDSMYDDESINQYNIVDVGKNHFLINKSDIGKLSLEHMDALYVLSNKEELKNPVYVDFDDDGRLLID